MKNTQSNRDKLYVLSNKMGLILINKKDTENTLVSKMLDISKPNRPEVKEFFQRQLENVAGQISEI